MFATYEITVNAYMAGGLLLLIAILAATLTALWVRRRAEQAEARLAATETLLADAERERADAIEARIAAERGAAQARAEAAAARERVADFERLRAQMLDAAKAAVTSTATQVSSKLLDDHKRETTEARKETEERVRKVNEALVRQMEDVARFIAALDDRVGKTGGDVETLMRAISSPGGAGQLAEIGLANTLQAFGLEAGRDFALQQTATDKESGRKLRPDAVVFLPTDTVLVIDCKASKFIMEIAEREGTPQEAVAYDKLARSMNQHLKSLSEKDYRNAIQNACKQAGKIGADSHVISMMYLPNDAALEKLRKADPDFFLKARDARIIPAGPAGLYSALLIAGAEIRRLRQMEGQKEIVEKTRALLDGLGIVLGYALRAGSGLKTAVDSFSKLTGSINSRLLPRARSLGKLGIESSRPLPPDLPDFATQPGDEATVIEGEGSEVEAEQRLLAK